MTTSLRKKYSTILDCAFAKNKTKCSCKVRVVNYTNVVTPLYGAYSFNEVEENNYDYRKIKLDDLIETVKHEQDLYEIVVNDMLDFEI